MLLAQHALSLKSEHQLAHHSSEPRQQKHPAAVVYSIQGSGITVCLESQSGKSIGAL